MSAKQRWVTFLIAVSVWVLLLFPWSPNKSYEHYAFSGPLISFMYSAPLADRIIGLPITGVLLLGIFSPILRLNAFTVVCSVASIIAWFSLSILAAASASV